VDAIDAVVDARRKRNGDVFRRLKEPKGRYFHYRDILIE
jgi:hypothetical protein